MNQRSPIVSLLVFFLILLVGGGFSMYLLSTRPETAPEEKPPSSRIVQTLPLVPQTRSVEISAFGTVIPSRKVAIRPQVAGQVIRQSESMALGGLVREGDELLRIDPKDYELALAEVRSDFEQARFELDVESGRQVIAKREWTELEPDLELQNVNPSLVLREPHLRRAQALVDNAENEIEKAELQLSRAVLQAPFNAMVVNESVEIGQLLDPNSMICELVGTDEFWVQVTVPFSKLKWIRSPKGDTPGAEATVILDTGQGQFARWAGRVIRLLSDLDPLGRMARLIVSVPDPLGLAQGTDRQIPLLLGSYVQVRIDAGVLDEALVIPREALREGSLIWVVGPDQRLQIHPADILWMEKDTLLIANDLEPDVELIVSDLRVALPGMNVTPQRSTRYPELQQDHAGAFADGP